MHLRPADYVIYVFGGVRATSRAIGRSASSVSRWQTYKNRDGLGGTIPSAIQGIILERASELKLDISADDLIHGREIKAC